VVIIPPNPPSAIGSEIDLFLHTKCGRAAVFIDLRRCGLRL